MDYNERLLKSNQTLLSAYEELDHNSERYTQELQAIAKMYEQLVNDEKTQLAYEQTMAEIEAAAEKTRVESDLRSKELELEKLKLEAQIEADSEKIRVEEEQLEEDRKANRRALWIDVLKGVGTVAAAVVTGVVQWKMFERATRKEEDEVLATQTEREVVKRGLGFRLRKD